MAMFAAGAAKLDRHPCLREAFSSTAAGDFVGSSSDVWLMNSSQLYQQALKASFLWSWERPKLKKQRAACNSRTPIFGKSSFLFC